MKKLGVFLLVFGASALFNRAELSSVDEGFIFNTTAALVEKHSWTMDEAAFGKEVQPLQPPALALRGAVLRGCGQVLRGSLRASGWRRSGTGCCSPVDCLHAF